MEFVQFHPTGMVWPPGVVGLLVTEAVRGEGGILRNATGERFMERYDPKRLELSTRDVVARAIYTEVKEGRGTPHGGVFLDVSHLARRDGASSKLPSMYDQFMELAGVDITREADGGRPHLPLRHGRRPRRRRDRCRAAVAGLFAAGECSGGMNGANRLGGNSLSDLLVFGRRTGESRGEVRRRRRRRRGSTRRSVAAARAEMTRYLTGPGDEDPYRLHAELQAVMQEDVGHLPRRGRADRALGRVEELERRAAGARAPPGRRASTPAGTSAATCATCSIVLRGGGARRARCARRVAARTAGSTSPTTTTTGRSTTSWCARTPDGMAVEPQARRQDGDARRAGRGAQGGGAGMSARALRLWRGDASGGELVDYEVEDVLGHGRARRGARGPAHPGAGPRRALELQGGEVRLMRRRGQRPPAPDVQDAARPPARGRADPRRAAARVPGHPRPRHRRLAGTTR